MISFPLNALRRALNTCAKFLPFTIVGSAGDHLFPGRKGKHVKHLSDHLARDIGLGPSEMARHRHVWPSQSVDRPPI